MARIIVRLVQLITLMIAKHALTDISWRLDIALLHVQLKIVKHAQDQIHKFAILVNPGLAGILLHLNVCAQLLIV
ncbi:unnamed protein product [Blepharisma stoltei]|uniref:Secreted protein n=1 Tax=Blepharisma stoltei TaxID=1481888 RepID=A0AAU9IXN0_9CILI|nr:unnamed protein product [Blepharisma stoltei]